MERGFVLKAKLTIDFPGLSVDIKVTSIDQPQSSCPFKSARQKIFGLGYSLLLFVYHKADNPREKTSNLNILHALFVDSKKTADYQMTRAIREMLAGNANMEDLVAYMRDRNLPMDDIEAYKIAEELLKKPPEQGYLTISNALQWRLQYGRIVDSRERLEGIIRLRG